MLEEEAQLVDRLQKLQAFVTGPLYAALPPIEQELLASQLFVMQSYASILNTRLRLATEIGVTVPNVN